MAEDAAPSEEGKDFGHVPDGWRVVRLAQVADLCSGGTPSKQRPDFWNGKIPWASPKDLKRPRLADTEDHISEAGLADGSRLVQAGTIFIVIRGMILARDVPVALAMVPMAFNQDMKAIIPRSEIDSEFLLYGLSAYKSRLLHHIGSAAHGTKRISTSAIENFRLPMPPLGEQRAIAQILRTVQQAKETTEKVIVAARQLKQSLMRHLFTYGAVPFARADRVTLKETEIGPVPEHWEVICLGDLIEDGPQNGIYKPESMYGRGTPIVRINDFGNDGDIIRRVPNRVNLTEGEIESYSLRVGDILINRVNSLTHLGKPALVGQLDEPTVYESNMMRFRLCPKAARTEFVFRWLSAPVSRRQLRGIAKRAVAQSSVNQGDVKSIRVPLPPVEDQSVIHSILDTIDRKIYSEGERANALSSLFQTLLHNLMTGKVRVHDVPAFATAGGTHAPGN